MDPSRQRGSRPRRFLRGRSRRSAPAARRSLTHGASFAAISFVVSALLSTVGSVVTARLYGVDIIGQVALAMAPAGMLALLSTVREQPGLVRRIAPLPPRDEQVTGIWLAVFGFSLALTVAVAIPIAVITWLLFQGPIAHPELFAPAMVYVAAYALISNSSWNLDSIFAAYGDGRQLFVVRLHETLVTLVLVAALSFHPSVWSPVLAAIVGWSTALVHRVVAARTWLSYKAGPDSVRGGLAELGDIVRFGLKMTPGWIATGTAAQAGTWTLGMVAPVAVVGAYSRAWSISQRVVEVNWRLGEMVFPALVERHARGDREGFDRVYVTAVRYSMTFLLGLAAVGGGTADAIMSFFGPGFQSAAPALALTLLVPCTATVATLQMCALLVLGLPGATSKVAVTTSAVTLIGTVVLTKPLGVTGPALAMALGGVLTVVFCAIIVRRHVRPSYRELWTYRQRGLLVVAYIVSFGVGRLAVSIIPGALGLLPALFAGTVAYILVFIMGRGLMPEDRKRLRQLADRVQGRSGGPAAEAPSASSSI